MEQLCKTIRGRALHYVFKVADRRATVFFYKDILGMKILRHEEFSEGCEAACNGPYANRWSKTMVGYGPEANHFVLELTYNYGVTDYRLGNDFLGITIVSESVISRAKMYNWPMKGGNGTYFLESPGGYKFTIIDDPEPHEGDPVVCVTLACSNLKTSLPFWRDILDMNVKEKDDDYATLCFGPNQCMLRLQEIGVPVDRFTGYGRIAFAVPHEQLGMIQNTIEEANCTVLTPLISLDTPGKATVTVVILADPDQHEICFVDEEGFSELSKVDPDAEKSLNKFINADKTAVS